MAKGLSSVQRTMRALREKGIICETVERFNPHVGEHGIRQDMFQIIDIICLDVVDTIGIQCCGSDLKKHKDKLTIEKAQNSIDWLSSPYRKLEIWSWRKVKLQRGGKAMRWQPKVYIITMDDFT